MTLYEYIGAIAVLVFAVIGLAFVIWMTVTGVAELFNAVAIYMKTKEIEQAYKG